MDNMLQLVMGCDSVIHWATSECLAASPFCAL